MKASRRAGSDAGSVRIIAGRWRGKRIPVPDLPGLRPTSDRSRETLFNWLQGEIPDAICLDGFAGSGALGLEALSRGALRVDFVESAKPAARHLEALTRDMNAEACKVHHADLGAWLAGTRPPAQPAFDLVFLDPPFDSELLAGICAHLEQGNWLAPAAWIYVETPAAAGLPGVPPGWRLHREMKTREAANRLYRRGEAPAP